MGLIGVIYRFIGFIRVYRVLQGVVGFVGFRVLWFRRRYARHVYITELLRGFFEIRKPVDPTGISEHTTRALNNPEGSD